MHLYPIPKKYTWYFFYDFHQALLQVEYTKEDLKLAEEELKIAESKRKYGLAEVLEVAKARNRTAESRSARSASLASYQQSIAALNRSVGIVIEARDYDLVGGI